MRRTLTKAAWGFGLLLPAAASAADWVALGTYTHGAPRQGIWLAAFDAATGTLSPPRLAAATADPSFLAQSPDGATLAACNEHTDTVSTFHLDRPTGQLAVRSRQPCPGGPAHVAISPDGRMLVACNYGNGTVAAFPLDPTGTIRPASLIYPLPGPLGPDAQRQSRSHAHAAVFAPDGDTVLVCDLGSDRVSAFGFSGRPPFLTTPARFAAAVPPGSGPRHLVFSRDGRRFAVVNEMAATVTTFAWPSPNQAPVREQTVALLPPDLTGAHGAAEIARSADERFLYASIRGPDVLTVLARDPSGRWRREQTIACGGQVPRSFGLDPTGRWLLCANQKSASLTLFQIDPTTGRLRPKARFPAPAEPVCVLWLR